MKNLRVKNLLLILLVAILTFGSIYVSAPTLRATAETQPVTVDIFSPTEYPEYFKTENAEYADEDEDHLVFTTKGSDNNYSIVVYHKNPESAKYNTYDVHTDILGAERGQISLWSYGEKDYLIYQSYMRLYALDLSMGVTIDASSEVVNALSSTNFCHNDNYFVVAQKDQTALVYTASVVDGKVTFEKKQEKYFSNISGVPLVSIAPNNTLYVHKDNTLYMGNISEIDPVSTTLSSTLISLYATNDRLYFIELSSNNTYNVGYFDVNNGLTKHNKITSVTLGEAKLGDLVAPKSLSIFDGKLLIVDNTKDSTIQRYNADTFEFVDWAIATTQPTDTRIDSNSLHISNYDGKIATLSDTSIKITDGKTGEVINVINYNTLEFTAKMLSIGKNTVAIASGDEIRIYSINCKDNNPINVISKKELYSCDYSSGKYYFVSLTDGGTIYVYNETDFSNDADIKSFKGKISSDAKIAVDVDGNISIYSTNDIYHKKASETAVSEYSFDKVCKGIETDLDGNVYVLSDNNVLIKLNVNGTTANTEYPFILHDNLKDSYTGIPSSASATSFAMNFDDKNVYFIINGQSLILTTDKFDNRSITDVSVGDVKSSLSGTVGDKNVQKATIVGANIFTVELTDTVFKYVERNVATGTEYLIIGEPYANAGYTLLLDENDLYLIKTEQLTGEVTAVTNSNVSEMYVSSDVNLYYYPVLSLDNAYCVYVDNEVLRLHVGQKLTVEGELTLNGKKFYYVSTLIDNVEQKGYLPETFLKTSIALYETQSTLTYIDVKKDTLMYSTDFSKVIYTFSEDCRVRYVSKTETHTLIEYYDGQNTYLGYVFNSAIIETTDNSIRNAVLIMVLSLAICATSIYLLHKRKVYVDAN